MLLLLLPPRFIARSTLENFITAMSTKFDPSTLSSCHRRKGLSAALQLTCIDIFMTHAASAKQHTKNIVVRSDGESH
jgi:hypothetical protein